MNEDVQNTASETAISSEQETQQEDVTVTETESPTQETEQGGAETAQAEQTASETQPDTDTAPFLEVKYNKELKGLSREEAKDWAEKGMHYESMHDKLDYIAAQSDISVNALLDKMMNSLEENKRAELVDRFGDDEETINGLMTLFRNSQKEKYDKVVADRKAAGEQAEQNSNARIAAEFSEMKKAYPELTDFSSLPTEVKKAAGEGVPLEYAYLKHQRTEKNKIDAANESAKRAAAASTGSVNGEAETKTEEERRFLAALWGG